MKTMRATGWIALILGAHCWAVPAADARTFSTEAEFLQTVLDPTTVSFNEEGVVRPGAQRMLARGPATPS